MADSYTSLTIDSFSRSELAVLRLLRRTQNRTKIAMDLDLAPRTVQILINSIQRKVQSKHDVGVLDRTRHLDLDFDPNKTSDKVVIDMRRIVIYP